MITRQARLGNPDPSIPFLYRRGDRVAWKGSSGRPTREFQGVIVDGWCEYEMGGGSYRATYLVERDDGMRFPAEEFMLAKVEGHPKGTYVRRYLMSAFRGWEIKEFEDFERASYGFRVENEETHESHCAMVSSEFLDDHSEGEIEPTLAARGLAETMRRAGSEIVLVTNSGLRIGLP